MHAAVARCVVALRRTEPRPVWPASPWHAHRKGRRPGLMVTVTLTLALSACPSLRVLAMGIPTVGFFYDTGACDAGMGECTKTTTAAPTTTTVATTVATTATALAMVVATTSGNVVATLPAGCAQLDSVVGGVTGAHEGSLIRAVADVATLAECAAECHAEPLCVYCAVHDTRGCQLQKTRGAYRRRCPRTCSHRVVRQGHAARVETGTHTLPPLHCAKWEKLTVCACAPLSCLYLAARCQAPP